MAHISTRHSIGGKRAAAKLLAIDPDHYKRIGSKGGKTNYGTPKGFAARPELARIAGAKGGRISKRGPSKLKEVENV